MKPNDPSVNGRDDSGRFRPGNTFGTRGSPHAARIAAWRKAFAEAVTEADIIAAVAELRKAVKKGEAWAVKELLGRTVGDIPAQEVAARLDELESLTEARR